MGRSFLAFVLVVGLAAACGGGEPDGPQAPRAAADLDAGTAGDEAAARGAALAFLRAYADPSPEGLRNLAAVVGPSWLRRWVFWVAVQVREFPGEMTGDLTVGSIGPSRPETQITDDIPQRSIDLSAIVTFDLVPETGDPSQLSLIFEGPILLARAAPGVWLVTDVVRDGLPLSATFQPLERPLPADEDGHLRAELDSFVAAPRWQFHVAVLQDGGGATALVDGTLVDANGQVVQEAVAATPSLSAVEPGEPTAGIVVFDPQASAEGLTLRLRFRDRALRTVGFPLEGVIEPIGA